MARLSAPNRAPAWCLLSDRVHNLPVLLQACLNGGRSRREHPAVPITPEDLARDAAAVVVAGAGALHVHPRDDDGAETLDARYVGRTLERLREVVAVPVGVSTGAWLLPASDDRLRAIEGWDVLPDFASVNFHEDGAIEVAELLLERGVAVEAGLWQAGAADIFAGSGLADRCLRILLEPMERSRDAALQNVAQIERRLVGVAETIPRLLHGSESTAWPMIDVAVSRGYQARMGLEDTLWDPAGALSAGNAHLIETAAKRIAAGGSSPPPGAGAGGRFWLTSGL